MSLRRLGIGTFAFVLTVISWTPPPAAAAPHYDHQAIARIVGPVPNVHFYRRAHRVWSSAQHAHIRGWRHRGYASRGWRGSRAPPRVAAAQPAQTLAIPGSEYLIAFSGIGGAIDRAAALRLAVAQQRTLRIYGYRETGAAVAFLARTHARHSLLGFSAGAQDSVLRPYVAALRRAGVVLPWSCTTIGLYGRARAFNDARIPCMHFLDASGQAHAGEANTVNLGARVAHLDPLTGALARVAAMVALAMIGHDWPRLASLPPPAGVTAEIPDDPVPLEREIADARRYLVATAHPGGTMSRQGPSVAIGLIHPVFAVRLARAIRAARSEGVPAGLMSAYRPPAFGVGGFRDKFNSLHSYGLAVDMGGIGGPGSAFARRWYAIAAAHGVHGPYGPYNGAEWNHYQLVPLKIVTAGNPLRRTITGRGPIALALMWLASGVGLAATAPIAIERPVIVARAHRQRYARVRFAARRIWRGDVRMAALASHDWRAPMHHYARRWHRHRG